MAADGVHTIKFTYDSEKYSYYTTSMFPIPSSPMLSEHGDPPPLSTNLKEFRLVKNNIAGVRLSQISFSNGTVKLNPSSVARTDLGRYINSEGSDDVVNTEAKALDNIAITSADFCKQFAFSYGYFKGDNTTTAAGMTTTHTSGSTIETDKTRLKLQSVVEKSCDGTVAANPWRFDYYSDFLPRRLSFAQDHWGYYNGQDKNSALNTLIPGYTVNTFEVVPGANRDAAWPAMANGALTKITYPTGGTSTFEFEPNDIWVNYKKTISG